MQIGNGVQVGAVHTNFSQGNFNEAGSPLQAAIQGNGFFVLRNSDGTQAYTRAGDFTVNNQGFLVASNGGHVMGYMAQNGQIPQGARLSDLQIPIGQVLAPNTTTNGTFRMNLNSSAETGSVFHAPMQVHDSLGNERTLDITFTRLANGTFDATGTLDGTAVQLNGGGTVNFAFDSSGNPTAPASLTVVPDQTQLDGATLPSIDVNLRQTNPDGSPGAFNITSFAMPSAVASTTQDGYGAGELNGALVDAQGMIYGTFSNGQSRVIGQYALANFNSEEGLGKAGGNMFKETTGSGQAIIGVPGSGSRGLIAGGYVEQSNVNITNEFIDLIEAQRGFQANSRVITTLNQTFQDLLQIV